MRRVLLIVLILLAIPATAQAAASWSSSDATTIFRYENHRITQARGWPVSSSVWVDDRYPNGAPGSATVTAEGGNLVASCSGLLRLHLAQTMPGRRVGRVIDCRGGGSWMVPLLTTPRPGHLYGEGYVDSGETIWVHVLLPCPSYVVPARSDGWPVWVRETVCGNTVTFP